MPDSEDTRLGKSFRHLGWKWIMKAVIVVYHENRENHEKNERNFKPSADIWCINESLRQDIHARTRQYWCKLTDLDFTDFPYSVDAIAKFYFRVRKRNKEEIAAFEREIGPIGPVKKDDVRDE